MAEGVSFSSVCDVLASVTEASGREEKTALLEKLFSGGADGEECSGGELPPASRCASELSFAIMRIVLPELDKERASYGMREKSLGDMIAQLLQLTRGGAAAERLRKWRDPVVQARTGGAVTAAGNFTAVLANVLEGRCSSTSSMSLRDVNDLLDRLNRCEVVYASRGPVSYGGSAGEERRKILRTFLSSLTDREVVWVTKVILKDMKLRIGYEAILRWFHPAALAHYKGTHNLALVCKECADPAFRIEAGEHVTLGAPALPMLCHRLRDAAQLHEVARCMPDGFYLEPKYDGERLQLHKMGGDVRCFSRNALETTDLYGSWLRDAVLSSVHAADCVLDGEVLLWNDGLGAFEKFERIRSYVSGADRSDSDAIWVKYMVFDVLYVDQVGSASTGVELCTGPRASRRPGIWPLGFFVCLFVCLFFCRLGRTWLCVSAGEMELDGCLTCRCGSAEKYCSGLLTRTPTLSALLMQKRRVVSRRCSRRWRSTSAESTRAL
mmetsp:Transcript_9549/g.28849  ORF Transcript_9549/g.28849 Transcript_9549/m.28849 type:complete len:496 (-) Transcript_9549:2577-4064(-)